MFSQPKQTIGYLPNFGKRQKQFDIINHNYERKLGIESHIANRMHEHSRPDVIMNGAIENNKIIKTEHQQDILWRMRYSNNLPHVSFRPKVLERKINNTRGFFEYKQMSLEQLHKRDLQSNVDLQLSIDLINKDLYAIGSDSPKMHPDDEALLDEGQTRRTPTYRSELNSRVVPWLRRTQYSEPITSNKRYGNSLNVGGNKCLPNVRERIEHVMAFPSREQQIAIVETAFEAAQTEITSHYSKPHVHKIREWHLFPDDEIWAYPCAQVIFDDEPVKESTQVDVHSTKPKLLSEALIRAISDTTGQQLMGFFLPSPESFKRLLRLDPNVEETSDDYEFSLVREYNWTVKQPSPHGDDNYFIVFRKDKATYKEFDHRIRLNKRRICAKGADAVKLIVQYRPPSEREKARKIRRCNQLSANFVANCHDTVDSESSTEDVDCHQEQSSVVGKNKSANRGNAKNHGIAIEGKDLQLVSD